VTSLLSRPTLNKWDFVRLQAVCVGSQSDTQVRNVLKGECYYRAKKHFREDLILPVLLSDHLSSVFEKIFQLKRRFCKRNKNCAARKKYSESERNSEESNNTSNMGQPRQ
jgi:hypothetical protein